MRLCRVDVHLARRERSNKAYRDVNLVQSRPAAPPAATRTTPFDGGPGLAL
ncbi:MAG: hypothetical protein OHK0024_22520 [Thalassobaculales bacterium]